MTVLKRQQTTKEYAKKSTTALSWIKSLFTSYSSIGSHWGLIANRFRDSDGDKIQKLEAQVASLQATVDSLIAKRTQAVSMHGSSEPTLEQQGQKLLNYLEVCTSSTQQYVSKSKSQNENTINQHQTSSLVSDEPVRKPQLPFSSADLQKVRFHNSCQCFFLFS